MSDKSKEQLEKCAYELYETEQQNIKLAERITKLEERIKELEEENEDLKSIKEVEVYDNGVSVINYNNGESKIVPSVWYRERILTWEDNVNG